MAQLQNYTDQESRLDRAFSQGGSCCSTWCEPCGRVYFVTSSGHGDYREGELDVLRKNSETEPDKYVEVPDFGSVSHVHLGGKQHVIGCCCGSLKPYLCFLDGNADEIAKYMALYWEQQRREYAMRLRDANAHLAALTDCRDPSYEGWRPIHEAPKNATWVEVMQEDGSTLRAHWASDLTGENQPAFQGWFKEGESSHEQSPDPLVWRPIKEGTESNG